MFLVILRLCFIVFNHFFYLKAEKRVRGDDNHSGPFLSQDSGILCAFSVGERHKYRAWFTPSITLLDFDLQL